MLDCQLYGMEPRGHHLTNLFFHLANTLLLFLFLNRTTAALWSSAMVAALFALHPMHVESVAWVAERKDVLSTFFWLATLWAYVWYVAAPGLKRYLALAGLLCHGPHGQAHAGHPALGAAAPGLLAPGPGCPWGWRRLLR